MEKEVRALHEHLGKQLLGTSRLNTSSRAECPIVPPSPAPSHFPVQTRVKENSCIRITRLPWRGQCPSALSKGSVSLVYKTSRCLLVAKGQKPGPFILQLTLPWYPVKLTVYQSIPPETLAKMIAVTWETWLNYNLIIGSIWSCVCVGVEEMSKKRLKSAFKLAWENLKAPPLQEQIRSK